MYSDILKYDEGLTFDDVLLKPLKSSVEPEEVNLNSKFSKNVSLNIPIVSAAMDTVTEEDMAIAMAREGGLGVIHRNMSVERQVSIVREVKRADEVVIKDVVTVSPDMPVSEVWEKMMEHGISGIPVVKDKLVGIVSKRDILPSLETNPGIPVEKVMTTELITGDSSISLEDALEKMYEYKIERLPVVDKSGRLVGIITMQDILARKEFPVANRDENGLLRVAAAVGPFDIERAKKLDSAGVDAVVVDCAHAHNENVVKNAERIRKEISCDLVAGNIATEEAAEDLVDISDGLKVGVGPGSICTTRIVAGVGVPQLTAIASVVKVAEKKKVPVIADGGIRYSGDIAKAIGAGADCVMIGNLLAGTDESPGRTIVVRGRKYKQYRGMGSLGAMSGVSDRYFQAPGKSKFVPEGIEGATPYRGNVKDVLFQLTGGLRSSMGYVGAKNIQEMKEKARFVRITQAGMIESHPHNVMITDEAPNYWME